MFIKLDKYYINPINICYIKTTETKNSQGNFLYGISICFNDPADSNIQYDFNDKDERQNFLNKIVSFAFHGYVK